MNNKNLVQICGWWGSANLGDRYQPLIIAQYLQSLGIPFQAMGYHATFKTSFIEKYKDSQIKTVEIFDPDPLTKAEYIIAVTGSLSAGYYSTILLKNMVEQNPNFKKLIIWGGFQDINTSIPAYSKENWQWLANERIIFIARSSWDLACLRALTQNSSIGILGGDPMCNWVPNTHIAQTSMDDPIVLVMSQLCFSKQPEIAQELVELAEKCNWKVGCFDGYTDRPLIKDNKYTLIRSPEHYFKWLSGAGGVVAVRLHAAILASVTQIPTVAIGTNEKFAAVGLHGLDSRILFPVHLEPSKALSALGTNEHSIASDYLELSRDTLKSLPQLLK